MRDIQSILMDDLHSQISRLVAEVRVQFDAPHERAIAEFQTRMFVFDFFFDSVTEVIVDEYLRAMGKSRPVYIG